MPDVDPELVVETYVLRRRSLGRVAADLDLEVEDVRAVLEAAGVPFRPRGRPRWTVLSRDELLRAVADGETVRSLAAREECSERTIRRAFNEAHIPLSRERLAMTLNLAFLTQRYVLDGATVEEIACEVGCSPPTVATALERVGIKRLSRHDRVARRLTREVLHAALEAGLTFSEVAAAVGVDRHTVASYAEEYDLR